MKEKTVEIVACVQVPKVPNFVFYADVEGVAKVSIAHLGNAELERLIERWGEALMERADELRRDPTAIEAP